MSSRQTGDAQQPSISEEAVADYLRRHPDFFDRHPRLLAELTLHHPAGKAISLIERQVTVLREQKRDVENKLQDLVRIAQENDTLNKRMQKVSLALLQASEPDAVFTTLRKHLLEDFKADSVSIRLFRPPLKHIDEQGLARLTSEQEARAVFKKFFQTRKPICGRLNRSQSEYLFAAEADQIQSAALLPICDLDCYGMLAIGSHDAKRFHPAMGTLFLSYLGDMAGRALRQHMPAAPA